MDNMLYFFKTVLCVHVKEMFPLPFEIILPKTSIESILNLWQGLGYLVLIGDQNLVTPSFIFSAIFLNA